MIKDSALFLFHCSFFIFTSYGVFQFFKIFDKFGFYGKTDPILVLNFLTLWGQFFLILFFGISTIVDLLNLVKFKKNNYFYFIALKIRDVLFRSIIFPICFVISSLFWGIYAYDRQLIFSIELDSIFPSYLNHLQHTLPGLLIIVETLIENHQYHASPVTLQKLKEGPSKHPIETITPITSDVKQDVSNLVLFILTYISIIAYTRYTIGHWPYPFLNVIPTHSKIIFIFTSSCFGVMLYAIGRLINQKRWGGESIFVPKNFVKKQSINKKTN
ncbi:hypothetical protein DICPUDRAFT_75292 [Dictyostelium purpureum]|uniref:Androgen-dependent TFPI-regulating protein n=1 Tax=Dictyostelium purpureum TaxID=5786 RepID=F0ZA88_DICPU|nr:uncharacterized protein DICPUDRAFT_75292 [Dictyostelium purpureum]EGC39190.1 hypothetical protein DICPUDRAFT_75292 [Dictyostelium purpureum]|eukprot:XP_003284336.1 hypothetical protein DICPUDRAFT_75292 [Dictyostelium purpureum]